MCRSSAMKPNSSMENNQESPGVERKTGFLKDESNMSYTADPDTHPKGSANSTNPIDTTEVCCGCRPKAKRNNRKFIKVRTPSNMFRRIRNWRYRDADIGDDSEWKPFSQNRDSRSVKSSENGHSDDGLYFFDAVDTPLGEEEYPIDGYAIGGRNFKVVFTASIQAPTRKASMSDPDSMLRPRSRSSSLGSMSSLNDDYQDAYELEPIETPNGKERILNHMEHSMRFRKIRKRTAEQLVVDLQTPIKDAIGMAGYPGTLTVEELNECQKFITGLSTLSPAVSEQIYSFRDIEDQPYTICRWLRATKFDAEAILKRCDDNQALFDEAKENNFYGPDLEEHLGCPLSVFLSQYPFLSIGSGKNGSPVNYFNIGKINPEGIMCLITINQLKSYFWYSFMHAFKDNIRESQQKNPGYCRCEGINVMDLSGMSASALTSETMEVIKIASKVSDFFPETLHCMLILNAPSFFTFSWKLIKKFIDPRTASRIQLFSSMEKGQKALEKLIDKDTEIPIDYGGGNISLREALLKQNNDSDILRQNIELLYCKRNGKKKLPNTWNLKADENIRITVYTRSISKASIEIILNGSIIKTVHAQCSLQQDQETGSMMPHPRKQLIMTSLAGPGEVMIQIQDEDTPVSKAHSNCSRGYFLVVGDVKKMTKKSRNRVPSTQDTPDYVKRKVSFSPNQGSMEKKRNYVYPSPYDMNKPPLGAKVTMTGLSFPTPIKVPPKHDRVMKRKMKLMKLRL